MSALENLVMERLVDNHKLAQYVNPFYGILEDKAAHCLHITAVLKS